MICSKKVKSDVTILDILYNIKDKNLPFLLDSAKEVIIKATNHT